mgnify:CR=1 FL=1
MGENSAKVKMSGEGDIANANPFRSENPLYFGGKQAFLGAQDQAKGRICTGFSTKIHEERFKDIGVNAVLMKPVTFNEMAEAVRKALDEGV